MFCYLCYSFVQAEYKLWLLCSHNGNAPHVHPPLTAFNRELENEKKITPLFHPVAVAPSAEEEAEAEATAVAQTEYPKRALPRGTHRKRLSAPRFAGGRRGRARGGRSRFSFFRCCCYRLLLVRRRRRRFWKEKRQGGRRGGVLEEGSSFGRRGWGADGRNFYPGGG